MRHLPLETLKAKNKMQVNYRRRFLRTITSPIVEFFNIHILLSPPHKIPKPFPSSPCDISYHFLLRLSRVTAVLEVAIVTHQDYYLFCWQSAHRLPTVLGNRAVSRILLMPVTYMTMRSKPSPKPLCGTVPKRRVSRYCRYASSGILRAVMAAASLS